MVLPCEHVHFLVADGVVHLLVLHIEQAHYFGELAVQPLQQPAAGIVDFLAEADYQHDFPLVVRADDERAQLSRVGVLVVETQSVRPCVVAYAVA